MHYQLWKMVLLHAYLYKGKFDARI